jgi:hypothetical protein
MQMIKNPKTRGTFYLVMFLPVFFTNIVFAQNKDTSAIIHVDSARLVQPTVGKVILQSIAGEVTFAGVFFGLNGKPFLYQDASETQAYLGAFAWWVSLFASSATIDILGNALNAGSGSYWHVFVGSLAGIILLPSFVSNSSGLFHRSAFFHYAVISNLPLLGEMIMYYLWPASYCSIHFT